MSTSTQFQVTLTVDGRVLGEFDAQGGGGTSGDVARHRAGGMGPEKTYAGLTSHGTITLSRVLERERDWELYRWALGRANHARGSAAEQPLDDDGNPWGRPITRVGRIGNVTADDTDSTSSDPRMWSIEFHVEAIA